MPSRFSAAVGALASIFDWRRALLLLPALLVVAVAVYYFGLRDTTGATPRASLLATDAPAGTDVGARKGQIARDFLASSPDGTPTSLAALRGHPVIVNFWATWCASCAAELPDLRDLQAELGPDALDIVAVNVGESSGAARKFINFVDAPGVRFVMDPTLVVTDAYGVAGLPHSVFLDADGVVRATYVGQVPPDIMREYVRAAAGRFDAVDIKGPLRFITGVARERTLEVRSIGDGEAELRSKSLRCDDSYCAAAAVEAFRGEPGVLAVEPRLAADPASIIVRFDEQTTGIRVLATLLAAALEAHTDPLYALPLEVVYP